MLRLLALILARKSTLSNPHSPGVLGLNDLVEIFLCLAVLRLPALCALAPLIGLLVDDLGNGDERDLVGIGLSMTRITSDFFLAAFFLVLYSAHIMLHW